MPNLLVKELARIAGLPADTRLPKLLRTAKRITHPDAGGTVEQIQRVHAIERALRDGGRL